MQVIHVVQGLRDVCSLPLPGFPNGIFVAMSNDKTFHFYDWVGIISNVNQPNTNEKAP
jgi:hypothetical protein